jgi:hypothetical protein
LKKERKYNILRVKNLKNRIQTSCKRELLKTGGSYDDQGDAGPETGTGVYQ